MLGFDTKKFVSYSMMFFKSRSIEFHLILHPDDCVPGRRFCQVDYKFINRFNKILFQILFFSLDQQVLWFGFDILVL